MHVRWHIISICFTTGDINFGHLIKRCWPGFSKVCLWLYEQYLAVLHKKIFGVYPVCFLCPRTGISNFSKESWFIVAMTFRKKYGNYVFSLLLGCSSSRSCHMIELGYIYMSISVHISFIHQKPQFHCISNSISTIWLISSFFPSSFYWDIIDI